MFNQIKTFEYDTDICIVGGGLSGTISAITAARKGAKVVLIQDRPVLGGNSSSEVRMWVRGCEGYCNKETGILNEFEEDNIYFNPTLSASLWDSVLFGKVKAEKNITLLLNTSCMSAETDGNKITCVAGWQLTTYSYHKVKAKIFCDCSGDSILAFLTDAKCRLGREGHAEFNETIGPEITDNMTMGMSLLLQSRETDHPVKFTPPDWAYTYETDEDFAIKPDHTVKYEKPEDAPKLLTRNHVIGTNGGNLWWIELGGDSGDPIGCTEEKRDELLKIALGIWDHIKNKGNHGYDNWELEWVGFLPGKRESVRYVGDYVFNQNDIEQNRLFEDAVAYGGWPMDDHNPKGFYANSTNEGPSKLYKVNPPYQIPYRCLYSVNIDNLMFAGRNISVTHAAMSSTRVMGTCSLLGQALGNASALCVKNNVLPRAIYTDYIKDLQREILDDGVMIPNLAREIPALSKKAKLNLSDEDKAVLFDGIERSRTEGDKHFIELNKGDALSFTFDKEEQISNLRLVFDLDYSRTSVSPNWKMRVFAQRLHTGLDFVPVKVANTIVKSFTVTADGKEIYSNDNNHNSFVSIPLNVKAKNISVTFNETWGYGKVNLFSADVK